MGPLTLVTQYHGEIVKQDNINHCISLTVDEVTTMLSKLYLLNMCNYFHSVKEWEDTGKPAVNGSA